MSLDSIERSSRSPGMKPVVHFLLMPLLIALLLQDSLSYGPSEFRFPCSRQLLLARCISNAPSLCIPSFPVPFLLHQKQCCCRAIYRRQPAKIEKAVQQRGQAQFVRSLFASTADCGEPCLYNYKLLGVVPRWGSF